MTEHLALELLHHARCHTSHLSLRVVAAVASRATVNSEARRVAEQLFPPDNFKYFVMWKAWAGGLSSPKCA
jgi:hypothetical protein